MRKFAFLCAAALLAGCVKGADNVQPAPAGGMNVTVRMAAPAASRAVTSGDMAGGTVVSSIKNGYLCFVGSSLMGNRITAVYTIGSSPTAGFNIAVSDLTGAKGVTLTHVPGTSERVHIFANVGTADIKPTVGGSIDDLLKIPLKGEELQAENVASHGEGSLSYDSSLKIYKAEVALQTPAAYLKLKAINFSGMGCVVKDIFINRYNSAMSFDGTKSSGYGTMPPEVYNPGTRVYPTNCAGIYYDVVGTTVSMSDASKLTPGDGRYWGYCLFTGSDTPQFVIKLSDIIYDGGRVNGDMFVTVDFKNAADGSPLTKLEGGKVYTIEDDALVIKLQHLNDTPGVSSFTAAVTVKPVQWQDADPIVPDL